MATVIESRISGHGPGGFALVVVLFILIALGLLTAGLVFISTEEAVIARSAEDLLRARLAAESAVRAEILSWEAEASREMTPGQVRERQQSDVGATTAIERLAGPHFLVRALATTGGGTVASAAVVVRGIEPTELWRLFPAALSTSGAVEVWGDEALRGFDDDPEGADPGMECTDPAAAELVSIFGSAMRPALETLPVVRTRDLMIGPLKIPELKILADRVETEEVVPRPAEGDGQCDQDAPANWGAPQSPWSPCFAFYPTILAPKGLRLTGGSGQGILIVDGDLSLSGDAEFFGAVILTGALHLSERATIHGAVTALGDQASARLEGESRIVYDPCALRSALAGTGLTNRVFHPRDRGWIPVF